MTDSDPARSVGRGVALEFAVQDLAGARLARELGADRVELCAALGATGGLTPSIGLVAEVAELGVAAHVLVRPRAGGFVYDADELRVLTADAHAAVSAGAAGLVFGALTSSGAVDQRAVEALTACADGVEVTFHRAFDVIPARSRVTALESLVALGVTRVLTSGGAARCRDGLVALEALTAAAGGRIEIMAGGGIDPGDIRAVVATGVDAVHLSARGADRRAGGSGDRGRPAGAGPGGGASAAEWTDPEVAGAAVRAWRALPAPTPAPPLGRLRAARPDSPG